MVRLAQSLLLSLSLLVATTAVAGAPSNESCEAKAAKMAKGCEAGCKKVMSNPAARTQKKAIPPEECASLCAKAQEGAAKDCAEGSKAHAQGKDGRHAN